MNHNNLDLIELDEYQNLNNWIFDGMIKKVNYHKYDIKILNDSDKIKLKKEFIIKKERLLELWEKKNKYTKPQDIKDILVQSDKFKLTSFVPIDFDPRIQLAISENLEFKSLEKQLEDNLINFDSFKNDYWIFYQNKDKTKFQKFKIVGEEEQFKIFLKVNGQYLLFFVNLIDKLFGDLIYTFKITHRLFEKRKSHKKYITYHNINDPLLVVYFMHEDNHDVKLYGNKNKIYLNRYKKIQSDMMTFIDKIHKIFGNNIDLYTNKPYKNELRIRKKEDGNEFIDFLQPNIYEGPSFTKKFNNLFSYCQGGFTESGKDKILIKNHIDENYYLGNMAESKIINNANALLELMEEFDGEYFYKKKTTFDLLNTYKFINSIERTKNLDFQINNLLWTHNRSEDIFVKQLNGDFGDPKNLVNKNDCKGVNFRYGLDSQYGEIIYIMKSDFFDNLTDEMFVTKTGEKSARGIYNIFTSNYINNTNNFVLNMHMKANSLLSNYRYQKNSEKTLFCNKNPHIIDDSVNTLYNILRKSSIHNNESRIQQLIDINTMANKYLFNNNFLENVQNHVEWCNYQIHICSNISIKDNVLAILIPNTIKPETRNLINKYLDIKDKIIEINVGKNDKDLFIYKYPNYLSDDVKDIHLQRRHSCSINEPHKPNDCNKIGYAMQGNSSFISMSPTAFKKYQYKYYDLILQEIMNRKLVGGDYRNIN